MIKPYFKSEDKSFFLLKGDSLELLEQFDHKFDMVFADPPYFLSNDGFSIQSGKIVSVNKGNWDKSFGIEYVNDFNRKWLTLVREKMKENATIWISGTMHNIFSVGQILTELGFKILNVITWEKTNPPPNVSCRFFTHSTEQIIWARKNANKPHYFNYDLMKRLNDDKQMKDVWKLPSIAPWEKSCGKHPTQKPLAVLTRIILASTEPNAWILDPFAGSSTTGIAANLANRRFLGIDKEEEFLKISKDRKTEINNPQTAESFREKIPGFLQKKQFSLFVANEPNPKNFKIVLGFIKTKDLNSITKTKTFYFHADIEKHNIEGFPEWILDAKRLFVYTGGRSKPRTLTGYFATPESISLKHKFEIKGKENSTTPYYYEIKLLNKFQVSTEFQFTFNSKILFEKNDKKNAKYLQKFLPALTTWEELGQSKLKKPEKLYNKS